MKNRLFAILLTILSITAFAQGTENWNYSAAGSVVGTDKVKILKGGKTYTALVSQFPRGGGGGIDWSTLGIRTFNVAKDSSLVYFNGLFYRSKTKTASSSDTGLLTK